jgi:hypothetical protein
MANINGYTEVDFNDGINTNDVEDLNRTSKIDFSTPNTIDIQATTVTINGQSIGGIANPLISDLDCANNNIINMGQYNINLTDFVFNTETNLSNLQGDVATLNTKTQNITATAGITNVVGNINVTNINNITAVGGLYSGLSDGALISGGTIGSLLPLSGVGSLLVPANGFSVGDSFHLVCAGDIPIGDKDDIITITLNQDGTQLAVLSVDMEDSTNTFFELEADFQVRSIGATGQIITNFDFTFNKQLLKDFKGSRKVQLSTIDTTSASTLTLTAQFAGQLNSTIQTRLFYLRKQF